MVSSVIFYPGMLSLKSANIVRKLILITQILKKLKQFSSDVDLPDREQLFSSVFKDKITILNILFLRAN